MAVIAINEATEEWLVKKVGTDWAERESEVEIAISNHKSMGIHKYPWTLEGTIVAGVIKDETMIHEDAGYVEYRNLWGWEDLKIKKVNPKQVIADFYLLDAIASGVLTSDKHDGVKSMNYNWPLLKAMFDADLAKKRKNNDDPLAVLMERALREFTELVMYNAPRFLAYSHYAITTELSFSKVKKYAMPSDSAFFYSFWNRLVQKAGGANAARWAAELFRNSKHGSWSASYGGEPWAGACDVVEMYEQRSCNGMPFGEREFLDRVFSLRHNTNTFLDKWDWQTGVGNLEVVLDAHAGSDWVTLTNHASEGIAHLFGEYLAHTDIKPLSHWRKETLNGYKQKPKKASPEKVNRKPVVKHMTSVYAGKCVTSGKAIEPGTPIVWHGKGKGASLESEWSKEQ